MAICNQQNDEVMHDGVSIDQEAQHMLPINTANKISQSGSEPTESEPTEPGSAFLDAPAGHWVLEELAVAGSKCCAVSVMQLPGQHGGK